MSRPTVYSDPEWWYAELDGVRSPPQQTERDAWHWLMAELQRQRDAAWAKAQEYKDEARHWHLEYLIAAAVLGGVDG